MRTLCINRSGQGKHGNTAAMCNEVGALALLRRVNARVRALVRLSEHVRIGGFHTDAISRLSLKIA